MGELGHLAAAGGQTAEEELGIHGRARGLGVQEAASVGRPPLRLVPVTVGRTHDANVGQVWTRGVHDEVGDSHVPLALARVGDEVPVQVGVGEVAPVR